VVLVGRGASALVGSHVECLRVFLGGHEAARVRSFADEIGTDVRRAGARLRRLDRIQRDYVARLFGRRLEDPMNYQIVLDTGSFGVEHLAELICQAAVRRVAETSYRAFG